MRRCNYILAYLLLSVTFLIQCNATKEPDKASLYRRVKPYIFPQKPRSDMVFVQAGKFWMGCDPKIHLNCSQDRQPYRLVYLDSFYIDKYEVTNEEYMKCVKNGACAPADYNNLHSSDDFKGNLQPVVRISWGDANNFCKWAGKRLPTEAEWEKAARGTDGRKYPWGNEGINIKNCNLANPCWNSKSTLPVGGREWGASPYGALDMLGNVWEWVNDWYAWDYYKNAPNRNPPGPERGKLQGRVIRGGGWRLVQEVIFVYTREEMKPEEKHEDLGFRCAQD
jgi:formylglycine-generating enzyme required for sulfatase activity